MHRLSLSEIVAPVFNRAHLALKNSTVRDVVFPGGRGSTKSSFCSIEIVLDIIRDPEANWLVLRKYKTSMRGSVFNTILWAIELLGLYHHFTFTVSPMEITYKPTGQKIIFSGLDDPTKLKSIKPRKGFIKGMWFEELTEFANMEEVRNATQSALRGGRNQRRLFSFNPPNDPNNWVNQEFKKDDPRRLVVHSDYTMVPEEWLGEYFIEEAEALRKNDPIAYRHEYLGEAIGRVDRLVFHDKYIVKDFEEPNTNEILNGRIFYGVDWGFANDDLAAVRCFIRGDNLYVDYEAGGVRIDIPDIAAQFDKVPEMNKWPIYSDSNRPELISYMKKQGYNIHAVKKWTGIVEDSVDYLRKFNKIVIHPRCDKLIKEMKYYSYKVDKETQNVLPKINDGNDHYIDALRYALIQYIKRKTSILDVI